MEEDNLTGLEVRFYQSQCLNEENVIKFENNGYMMIDSILFSDVYQIHRKTGIPMETIFSIQTNLQKMFGSVPINGYQHYLNIKEFSKSYLIGIEPIDSLLNYNNTSNINNNNGNGFKCGEIYEFVGSTSCGKTQIAMNCSLNLSSIYKENVIYIDSSNSFSSNRLVEIYKSNYHLKKQQQRNNNNSDNSDNIEQDKLLKILDRIKVFNCFDSISLHELLLIISNDLEEINSSNNNNNNSGGNSKSIFFKSLRMIIIDSIGTLLSPIIGGKQTQGHYMMMAISRLIKTIADTHQIIFIITNNIVSGGNSFNSNSNNDNNSSSKAALGEAWAMVPNHQFMINHHYYDDEIEERSIFIEKSTRLPKKSIIKSFKIKDYGIVS